MMSDIVQKSPGPGLSRRWCPAAGFAGGSEQRAARRVQQEEASLLRTPPRASGGASSGRRDSARACRRPLAHLPGALQRSVAEQLSAARVALEL